MPLDLVAGHCNAVLAAGKTETSVEVVGQGEEIESEFETLADETEESLGLSGMPKGAAY